MLQMNNLELAAFVEAQLEQNPLLERADGTDATQADGDIKADDNLDALAQATPMDSFAEDAPPPELGGEEDFTVQADSHDHATSAQTSADSPLDTNFENHWDDGNEQGLGNLASWQGGGGDPFADTESMIDQQTGTLGLRDHVLRQIAEDIATPADRIIASYLVDGLDEAGYWRGDTHQVAQALECAPERVSLTLLRLQQLDPPGVFARNLAECLQLQLREKNRLDPWMQLLLQNLEMLGAHKLPELQKIIGCTAEDLKQMITEIRSLNPKPGEAFAHNRAETLLPDIFLRWQKGGGWQIELNADTLPRVLVNNRYFAQIKTQAQGGGDKKYLAEKFQAANFLIKAMHQRAQTMIKVTTEIVKQQESFFTYGVEYLRPLVRREIAALTGLHESTISRVAMGKYLATPRGVFELRYFFSTSLPGADGRVAHSSASVRHKIKTLIDQEPPGKPLSDDKLVALLRADGVDIARRTIAKYREQMNIPASSDRKRLSQIKM